jgi:hypothetical protein
MNNNLDYNRKKQILIDLLNKGDPKRKLHLYQFYQEYFLENYSTAYLIDFINEDLGLSECRISKTDIKYIKSKFLRKEFSKAVEKEKIQPQNATSNNLEIKKQIDLSTIDFKEAINRPKSLD